MFRPLALLSAVLAVGISVTDAKLEDKFVKPFTVNPECGQLGVAPAGLAAELPDGYDYSCYEPSPINKRWSTEDGLDMNDFFGEDADMMGALIPYLQSMIMIVAPILAFGIISVIGCCCWSCGMLECCAGGNGKPRKGCGKCCANPPKWTEGFFEWILMAVTLFLGVVVVGLALKGLAVNKIQNDAIEKLVRIFSNFFPPSHCVAFGKRGKKNAFHPIPNRFFCFRFFFSSVSFLLFLYSGSEI